MTTQTHISFNSPLWSVGLTDTQRRTVMRWVYENNRQDCVGLRIYPDKVETVHVRYHEQTPEEEFTMPVMENGELSLEARPTDTEKPFPDLPWDSVATRIDAWAQETFPAQMWPRHYYPEGPDSAAEPSYPSETPCTHDYTIINPAPGNENHAPVVACRLCRTVWHNHTPAHRGDTILIPGHGTPPRHQRTR